MRSAVLSFASVNLGVFLCPRCAGLHRKLGTHVSRVKSITQDAWTPEQINVCFLLSKGLCELFVLAVHGRQWQQEGARQLFVQGAARCSGHGHVSSMQLGRLTFVRQIFEFMKRKYENKEFLRPEGATDY